VSWDNLAWRPADASYPEGTAPILNEKDLLKSALEEAVSTMLMSSITLVGIEVAEVASADVLPSEFTVIATFEMLGKERTPLAVALDPEGGDHLAGSTFDPGEMGWNLAEALDQAVEAIAGEGLQAQMSDGGAMPAGEPLVLLRITLADSEGTTARLVVATPAEVPADLAMHLILVKEIGKISMDAPAPRAKRAAPVPSPETTPAPAAASDPSAGMPGSVTDPAAGYAGYPGMPAGYPGMPAGYPAPGSYPGMPTMSAQAGYPGAGYPGAGYPQQGYPQQGYPQQGYPQQGGYPAYPGMPGYPGSPIGTPNPEYPPNVRPLTLDEFGPGSGPMNGGSGMDMLSGVNLEVTVEIGRTRLPIREVLALGPGSLVELDKLAGEKVDVLVNGHLIASGEVIVYEENFGVRITEVSARARRLAMGEGVA
jgi:flagellar motor switch protein FliN